MILWIYIFVAYKIYGIFSLPSKCKSSSFGDMWISKEIWAASYGETFHCMTETGNIFDLFAVAVVRDGEIIGHLPKLISAASSQFQYQAQVL